MSIRRLSLLCGVSCVASVLALASPARAQEMRDFSIPEGPLGDALTTFVRQADRQILFTSDQVAGRRTAGVQGRLAPVTALERILAGSGLGWTSSRPGVFVLRPLETADAEPTELEDIVVTGSLLRGPADSPSPVTVIRRDEIDRLGRATVADALVGLPQNYAGSATPTSALIGSDPTQSNTGLATGVNLRGLGPDSTLVLVNGRRLSGTGGKGDFADVSAIPTSAVERVDVLLDGASALYGSDAVGGVVNIILRDRFDGQESRLRIGAVEGGAENLILGHTIGRNWETGGVLLSYEFERQKTLSGADRPYSATGDLRPFGGTDHRTIYSAPGNIVALDPGGAGYVSRFSIVPGSAGTATSPVDFVAGQTNFGNPRAGIDLLPEQDRHSAYARISQNLGDRIVFSADARFSQREFDVTAPAPQTIATVSSANPFFVSPNGSTSHQIAYSFARDTGPSRRSGTSRSLGLSAGLRIALAGSWDADVYAAFASERAENRQSGMLQSTHLQEALGNTADAAATSYSAGRDGFLNLFGSGAANTRAVLDFISSGYTASVDESEIASVNVLVQGTAFHLPGGDLKVAAGAQVRSETLKTSGENFLSGLLPVVSATPDRDRQVSAAFVEARIPIIGEANGGPGLRRLELSIAGRIETYDDIGSTTNPKVGVVWIPAQGLKFRSTWGTSFRAPALTELAERRYISATYVSDGVSRRVALFEGGGNPDLKPETAETFTVGVDLQPTWLPGFTASLTGFDIRFDDQIARPALDNLSQALLDPSLRPFVRLIDQSNAADRAIVEALISSPDFLLPGVLPANAYGLVVDGRWVNATSLRVRGIDASAAYDFDRGENQFRVEAGGSWMTDYKRQITSAAPVQNMVGLLGYPVDLRGSVSASWTRGPFSLRLTGHHVARYRDLSGRTIQDWNTADALASWSPNGEGLSQGVQLNLVVRNLFDEAPPFYDATSGLGFDPGQADPLGRLVALQLTKRW